MHPYKWAIADVLSEKKKKKEKKKKAFFSTLNRSYNDLKRHGILFDVIHAFFYKQLHFLPASTWRCL